MTTITKTSGKPLRAAIYTRISDDADGEGLGVERQKADCLKRAEREGWHVVRVLTENDTGASRHSKKPRPRYGDMVETAERGEVDVVLAYSNSRLTRRPMELEALIDLHDRRGVLLRTIVSGDDDLSTADGRMVARIKASVDAAEADRTSERVLRAQAGKRERGEWLGGFRPFGWGWSEFVDGKRTDHDVDELNTDEAELIRAAAGHLLEGGSVGAIIRQWNEAGVTTTRGKPWRHMSVNRVVTRYRNAGVLEVDGKPRPDVAVPFGPILTLQEVEQLRAILGDHNRSQNGGRGFAPKHLLSGIATCGKCGHVLKSGAVYGRTSKDGSQRARYGMYRCSGPGCYLAIHIDTADATVSRKIVQAYAHGAPNGVAARVETDEALASTHRALAGVLAERAELVGLINDRIVTAAEVRPRLSALTRREDELRADVGRIHREDAHSAMTAAAIDALVTDHRKDGSMRTRLPFDNVDAMVEKWQAMELEARRRLIRALVSVSVVPAEGRQRVDRVVVERR